MLDTVRGAARGQTVPCEAPYNSSVNANKRGNDAEESITPKRVSTYRVAATTLGSADAKRTENRVPQDRAFCGGARSFRCTALVNKDYVTARFYEY